MISISNAEGLVFWKQVGLACGIAAPLLYFGSQAAAAPFYGGYDWSRQLASELGAGIEPAATIFNAGMILTGCTTIFAAFAFFEAIRRLTSQMGSAAVVALSLISSGGATLWAGLHPLPSPAHNPGLWGVGTVVVPVALLWALRHKRTPVLLRTYLAGSFSLAIAALMVGEAQVAPVGLLQRIAAGFVYPPMAVAAMFLLHQRQKYE